MHEHIGRRQNSHHIIAVTSQQRRRTKRLGEAADIFAHRPIAEDD
jgi:hypothetical protein